MTDKTIRDAFEREAATYFGHLTLKRTNYVDGYYVDQTVNNAWLLWQAACDHYAPKLTENEAVEAAAEAIRSAPSKRMIAYRETATGFQADGDTVVKREVITYVPCLTEQAKAALRAAGVRFRETELRPQLSPETEAAARLMSEGLGK